MYEIPFFVWTSDEFDSSYTFDYDPERLYVLDDLMHSLSDFSQINFLKFDSSKSIFSKDFQSKPRIIGNKIDYDEYFKE
jgi:heptose-I-phosphate ethanolaminephosphotransferase